MNYKLAQDKIFELTGHVSQLIFSYIKEDGTVEGQLTTGNPLAPIIPVSSSQVCESDLFEALETEAVVSDIVPHTPTLDLDVWGYFLHTH